MRRLPVLWGLVIEGTEAGWRQSGGGELAGGRKCGFPGKVGMCYRGSRVCLPGLTM